MFPLRLQETVENWYHFFLKYLVVFTNEPIVARGLLSWKVNY